MTSMTEFRLHGRGGQGTVMAAAVFAEAAFREGFYARAFSLFGAERRGAPVTAFIRVSSDSLMPRCRIYQPDYVAVFDATISSTTVLLGLKEEGVLLVNVGEKEEPIFYRELPQESTIKIYQVDASAIAARYNLTIGSFPAVNTVMIGALARISSLASLDTVLSAVEKNMSSRREENLRAAAEGYREVKEVLCLA